MLYMFTFRPGSLRCFSLTRKLLTWVLLTCKQTLQPGLLGHAAARWRLQSRVIST